MIPVTKVVVEPRTKRLVADVLDSGRLSAGAMVAELEQRLCEVHGVRHAVAVSSGTEAIALVVHVLGLRHVAVPAFTFAGTAFGAMRGGASVTVLDVNDDFQLPPVDSDAFDGVIPVDLFGAPARTDYLGPVVVEDAAQFVGGQVRHTAALSFYGSKTVGAGEGGAVLTNDAVLASEVRIVANQGMRNRYEHVRAGWNARMSDVTAAVALGQLDLLGWRIERRRNNARYLLDGLAGWPVVLPRDLIGHTWHQFVIRVANRDRVAAELAAHGVESRVYYPVALDEVPGMSWGAGPNARRLAREVLALPVHEHLSSAELSHIVMSARDSLRVAA